MSKFGNDMINRGKILIADDEETFLQSTAEMLQDAGYQCDCAIDSMSAQECLAKNDYDLLISDINMPGNVKLEFLKGVYRQNKLLPVIVITGFPSLPTAVDSFRLAAVDYLQKPIDGQELLELVNRATQKRKILRALNQTHRDVKSLTHTLEHLEAGVLSLNGALAAETKGVALGAYFDRVVSHLASVSVNLKNTLDRVKDGEGAVESSNSVEDLCPTCSKYRETLYQTTLVLARTKDAFKSKVLGELRRRIEHVLQSTVVGQPQVYPRKAEDTVKNMEEFGS